VANNGKKLNRRHFLFTASQFAALAASNSSLCGMALAKSLRAQKAGSQDAAVTPHGIYQIRQLSEHELQELYEQILGDACAQAATGWKTAAFDSRAGFWGDGISGGNSGIRTIVSMLLACATVIKYSRHIDAAMRTDLAEKSRAAVRFTVATHRTGAAKCSDGKQWGATPGFGPGSWQSGMWTGTLAWGTRLIWDQLDLESRQSLERVVAWECDILSQRQPPNGLWLDTKAEENGWEVPCLVLGALMFPANPHASDWQQAACQYMMNTLCTEADTHDASLSDGHPVNEWIKGANLQLDFTLENHNIFHPSYVGCSCYFLTQAVMYYTYERHAVPQAATHHLLDTWRMFQTIILPWGEAAYPQGMDWELHGLTFINLYAALATHWHDPLAAHHEQCILQYLRAWQAMGQGSLAIPGSRLGIERHAVNCEQVSYGFLAHKIFGSAVAPVSYRAAAVQEQGVHDYPYVDFIAHRTQKKFASFSWKNKIMGLLIPLGDGHESNPDFIVPIQNGFVGSFELEPVGDAKGDKKITVVDHDRRRVSDGFETSGTLLLNSGRLKQRIRMTSVGSQTAIYEDEVTALDDITVEKELGMPIGIENDEITGGNRVVTSQDAQVVVNWKDPKPSMAIAGRWVNIDSRLAVVTIAGSGLLLAPSSGYLPGISVCCDTLYGSYSDRPRQFKAGEVIVHRMAVALVEVTPQETSRIVQSCRIEGPGGSQFLTFKQPDGQDCRAPIAFGQLKPSIS
jgi:hypothetical protein